MCVFFFLECGYESVRRVFHLSSYVRSRYQKGENVLYKGADGRQLLGTPPPPALFFQHAPISTPQKSPEKPGIH
eukprot:COSAG05_NODE_17136_length_331_cov_0.866379_1_plen_73_part_10